MPSKQRIAPTKAVRETARGPVRVAYSAEAPVCSKCGHSENVVRLWHGGRKMWACSIHYKITSTRKKEATLKQRILHQIPEPDTFSLREVLPNRAMRRRRTR